MGLKRQYLIVVIYVASVVISFAAGYFIRQPETSTSEHVTFLKDWLPVPFHTPFYAGLMEGFYSEMGLSVTVLDGKGSGDTVQKVSEGLADVGIADCITTLTAISKGINVTIVGVFNHNFGMGVRFIKGRGIESPKDLQGKIHGSTVGDVVHIIFPLFAELASVDASRVTWKSLSASLCYSAMLDGTVDFVTGIVGGDELVALQLKKEGLELGTINFGDWIKAYGHVFIANEEFLKEKPDVLKRFMWASIRSITWSMKNVDRAVDDFVQAVSGVDREGMKAGWIASTDHLLVDEFSKVEGYGFVHPEKMTETVKIANRFWNLTLTADILYTNRFVEGVPEDWATVD